MMATAEDKAKAKAAQRDKEAEKGLLARKTRKTTKTPRRDQREGRKPSS